ncbi:hypothetical protein GQX73_g102 [Xylaria multiplex]|uniref:Infection structure specific protein n=1 Tax=Xylaria multiplex TaxID=323545 RepID=A0A7C8N1F9_9PEZI|nr:hypothetical protein GQX73_g102 [Xylaria multiplex]
MLSKVLLTTAVIGAATAQLPAIVKRDFIENRQFDDIGVDPTCQSALSAIQTIYSSVPTPPADLLTATLPADPCATPSFTGSLQSEWNSYTSEALQWYASHTSDFASFFTACPDLVDESATNVPVCSSDLAGLGGAATTTPPAQTTGSSESASSPTVTDATTTGATESEATSSAGASSSQSPSSTVSTGAAPHQTSFVMAAAVAAVGFMGAVAVL